MNKNKESKQKTFDYCMYMMLSSYFARATCTTRIHESQLYLYYQEEKAEEQIRMEQQCIRLAESEILPKIPAGMLRKSVRIHLIGCQSSNRTTMQIWCGRYVICIKTKYHKSNPGVSVEVWKKTEFFDNQQIYRGCCEQLVIIQLNSETAPVLCARWATCQFYCTI